MVVGVYDYEPITVFEVRSGGGDPDDYVIEAVDYIESDPAIPPKIPKNSIILFRAKIKVTTDSPNLPYNS